MAKKKKVSRKITIKTFKPERTKIKRLQKDTRIASKEFKKEIGTMFGGTRIQSIAVVKQGKNVGTVTYDSANEPTKERVKSLQRSLEIDKQSKLRAEEISKLKKELAIKRIAEAKRVAGLAATKVTAMIDSTLKQKVKSKRVLKRGKSTLVIRTGGLEPYKPIYFKG